MSLTIVSLDNIVVENKDVIGENPLWNPVEKMLYWADIIKGSIYRYDPKSGRHEEYYKGETFGGFCFQKDGSLLLFGENGSVKKLKDSKLTTIIEEIPAERGTRFNDVIADPAGRVYCGTVPHGAQKEVPKGETELAHIYCLDIDGSITKLIDVGISNGFGFTPNQKQMYYTDTLAREVLLADYDKETGNLKNHSVFVKNPSFMGLPDGMTVDKEGYVWIAYWDGGCLVRYTPEGEEDLRFQFPAKKVTSIIFGGENYQDIYVTTGGGDKKEEGDGAGALFRLDLGIQGVPEFLSKIVL